jgi:hypothetical protein
MEVATQPDYDSPLSQFSIPFVVAVASVAVYFITLLVGLVHAVRDVPWSARAARFDPFPATKIAFTARASTAMRNVIVFVFAGAAVTLAWYHITLFMLDDRAKYADTRTWVEKSSWFVQAYEQVTATPQQWYWSAQLLHGVVSISVFMYVESFRCGIRPLSSFWLGCAAAISLAFPLFAAAVWNTPRHAWTRNYYVPLPRILFLGAMVAMVAVMLLPVVDSSAYGPVLGTVHISLLLPLAFAQLFPREFGPRREIIAATADSRLYRHRLVLHAVASVWVPLLYGGISASATVAHANNVINVLQTAPPGKFLDTIAGAFCANHCQCSISGDVVATSVVAAAIMLFTRPDGLRLRWSLLMIGLTPLCSFGATLPAFLGMREVVTIQRRGAAAEKILAMATADGRTPAVTPPPTRSPAAIPLELKAATLRRRGPAATAGAANESNEGLLSTSKSDKTGASNDSLE